MLLVSGSGQIIECFFIRVQVSDQWWGGEIYPRGRGVNPAREKHTAGELHRPGGLQPGAGHHHPGGVLQVSQKHMWMQTLSRCICCTYLIFVLKKKTSCVEKLLQHALMFFIYLHAWGDPVITDIADGIISRAKGFSGCCKLTSGILFLEFTLTFVELCGTSLGIMEMFLLTKSSTSPSRICPPDTSKAQDSSKSSSTCSL